MNNCLVPWYTVVDKMYVDEMSIDEFSWNPRPGRHASTDRSLSRLLPGEGFSEASIGSEAYNEEEQVLRVVSTWPRYRKPLVNGNAEDVHGAAAGSSRDRWCSRQRGL